MGEELSCYSKSARRPREQIGTRVTRAVCAWQAQCILYQANPAHGTECGSGIMARYNMRRQET